MTRRESTGASRLSFRASRAQKEVELNRELSGEDDDDDRGLRNVSIAPGAYPSPGFCTGPTATTENVSSTLEMTTTTAIPTLEQQQQQQHYEYKGQRGQQQQTDCELEAELAPNVDEIVAELIREDRSRIVHADVVVHDLLQKSEIFLPKFSKEKEIHYQAEYSALSRASQRYTVPCFVVTYLFYSLFDIAQQPGRTGLITVIVIRCFVAVAVTLCHVTVIYRAPSNSSIQRWSQEIMLFISTLFNLSVVAILYVLDDGFVVGVAGIGICILVTCTLAMLRLPYSLIVVLSTVALTNLLIAYDNNDDNGRSCYYPRWYVFVNTNLFLFGFSLFGFVFSYLSQLYLRRRFSDVGTIFKWESSQQSTTS